MNSNEWYLSTSTRPMLSYLRDAGLLSSRKQVLLACASNGPASLHDPYYQLAARFVDGDAATNDNDDALAALQREPDEDPYFWDRCHNRSAMSGPAVPSGIRSRPLRARWRPGW